MTPTDIPPVVIRRKLGNKFEVSAPAGNYVAFGVPQVSIRKSNHGSKENKGDTDDSKNENENENSSNGNSNSSSSSSTTKKSRMRRKQTMFAE